MRTRSALTTFTARVATGPFRSTGMRMVGRIASFTSSNLMTRAGSPSRTH